MPVLLEKQLGLQGLEQSGREGVEVRQDNLVGLWRPEQGLSFILQEARVTRDLKASQGML